MGRFAAEMGAGAARVALFDLFAHIDEDEAPREACLLLECG
jgi:hypothetical protein